MDMKYAKNHLWGHARLRTIRVCFLQCQQDEAQPNEATLAFVCYGMHAYGIRSKIDIAAASRLLACNLGTEKQRSCAFSSVIAKFV